MRLPLLRRDSFDSAWPAQSIFDMALTNLKHALHSMLFELEKFNQMIEFGGDNDCAEMMHNSWFALRREHYINTCLPAWPA